MLHRVNNFGGRIRVAFAREGARNSRMRMRATADSSRGDRTRASLRCNRMHRVVYAGPITLAHSTRRPRM